MALETCLVAGPALVEDDRSPLRSRSPDRRRILGAESAIRERDHFTLWPHPLDVYPYLELAADGDERDLGRVAEVELEARPAIRKTRLSVLALLQPDLLRLPSQIDGEDPA
jgi:hypothetical protein